MKKLMYMLFISMPLATSGSNTQEPSESLQQHILDLCRSEIIPISSTQCMIAELRATLGKERLRKEKERETLAILLKKQEAWRQQQLDWQ